MRDEAIFATARYQLTRARPIPWSHWLTATGAVQVNGSHLFLSAEAGAFYLENPKHRLWAPLVNVNVGLAWRVWGSSASAYSSRSRLSDARNGP